jgi:hypothetical protein
MAVQPSKERPRDRRLTREHERDLEKFMDLPAASGAASGLGLERPTGFCKRP